MTRGNQRDRDRAKNLKKEASQKKATNLSGSEMQRARESAAEVMRKKQAAADAKKQATKDAELKAKKEAGGSKKK